MEQFEYFQDKPNLLQSSFGSGKKSLSLLEKHKFEEGTRTYHISIIDYLQEWNLNKKAERFVKTQWLRKDPDWISAVEPNLYAQRFKEFMTEVVFE